VRSAKRFEELWIWQQARDLVRQIYKDFESGAGAKDFAFRDQARRAATSVTSNLAEGFERSTDADFARFLDVAKASCGEVRSLYYAAEDLGYVPPTRAEEVRVITRKLAAGIARFAQHLRNSATPDGRRGPSRS
jgi:four helix bundle protein